MTMWFTAIDGKGFEKRGTHIYYRAKESKYLLLNQSQIGCIAFVHC